MSVPSIRKATRTCARYSSRFSPRIPVLTMSTARMFRSEVCACFSACIAASSLDVLELPTNSMILTTATLPSCSSLDAVVLAGARAPGKCRRPGYAFLKRRSLPWALSRTVTWAGGRGLRQEPLERRDHRGGLATRGRLREELDAGPGRVALAVGSHCRNLTPSRHPRV